MSAPTLAEVIALVQALVSSPLEEPLAGDTSLLAGGLLDSFQLLDLVESLEDAYGFAARASEVTPENFETPERVWAYVLAKGAAG